MLDTVELGAGGSEAILGQLMEIARISALAEMASGIAHEINQPLGAIATYAQAAERMLGRPDPMVSQTIEILHHIQQQALDAGAGIHRIRHLFDQDSSMRSRCQMAEVVEELRPILDMMVDRVGGRLQVDAEADLPATAIDRLRIQHVIFALVQNACDAGVESGGTPLIQIAIRSDRYIVETSVSDSGPGVPPGLNCEMFRPFFTTKHNGTGLGLASSRAIVESHEGTIGFENVTSGGSRFWFRLPISFP